MVKFYMLKCFVINLFLYFRCKDITSSKVCEKYDYCEFNKLTVQC